MATRITGARQAGEAVRRQLTSIATRQVRYAGWQALNDAVYETAMKTRQIMPQYIDRPTPYTQRQVDYEKAKYETVRAAGPIVASVYIPYEWGNKSGRPAAKYLQYQVYGGGRGEKGFEFALMRAGVMFPGEYAVPASGAKLDTYGNMPTSFIRLLLSWFNAAEWTRGFKANLSDRTRKRLLGQRKYYVIDKKGRKRLVKTSVLKGDTTRPGFSTVNVADGKYRYGTTLGFQKDTRYGGQSFGRLFVGGRRRGSSGTHLKPGIYSATGIGGSNIKPIILFTRQPFYRIRFPFHRIVQPIALRFFRNKFKARMAAALATAKQP